jgi:hypothetical protein
MDVSDAPRRPPDEIRGVTLASLPQTGLTSTQIEAGTTASAAGGQPQMMVHSDDKPTGIETEAGLPQTLSVRERSTATGTTSTVPGTGLVHQPWQESSATALLDVQDAKPVIEAEGQPIAGFTCYRSALAVTQDHPDAWPSWTLHALGHEGVRCWHATTRAAAHEQRTEMPRKKQRVGTLDNLGSPARQAD